MSLLLLLRTLSPDVVTTVKYMGATISTAKTSATISQAKTTATIRR